MLGSQRFDSSSESFGDSSSSSSEGAEGDQFQEMFYILRENLGKLFPLEQDVSLIRTVEKVCPICFDHVSKCEGKHTPVKFKDETTKEEEICRLMRNYKAFLRQAKANPTKENIDRIVAFTQCLKETWQELDDSYPDGSSLNSTESSSSTM